VVDPVIISTSGDRLLQTSATEALCELLLPLASVITPNTDEASFLTGISIENQAELRAAGEILLKRYPKAVLVMKGGHLPENKTNGIVKDLILSAEGEMMLGSIFRKDIQTHGTGCTFSAAITAGIAKGKSIQDAIKDAKNYITKAIQMAPTGLGKGASPLKHAIK